MKQHILNTSHTTSHKTQPKNTTHRHQATQSSDPASILSISFLMGMFSLVMIVLQRLSTGTIINIHNTLAFSSTALPYSASQSSYSSIQFPGLVPLVMCGSLAYKTGSTGVGLLSLPLWLTTPVSAQSLPAVIDFNNTFTAGQVLVVSGGAAGDYAGYSAYRAGDVNGDGKDDFLVGAYQASPDGRIQAGAAHLIYGSAYWSISLYLGSVIAFQRVVLQGGAAGDQTGISVAGVGDVNGDGKADILVGAYGASPGGRAKAGLAYLIYGSANLTATQNLGGLTAAQGVVLQGGAAGDQAGVSVASAGDVNGDGRPDFLIGASAATPGGRTGAGSAYLIYGSANLPSIINLGSLMAAQGVVLQGGAAFDKAGFSVANAGDVNGDGISDFLIGAYTADPVGRADAGAVYLVYGSTRLPAVINLGSLTPGLGTILQGRASSDYMGLSVSGAGDVNGDGRSDFLMGAPYADPGGRSNAGVAYLIYGSANLPAILDLASLSSTQGLVLQGSAANDNSGSCVSNAGDINGDGKSDFLIGAYNADPAGRTDAGAAYLIYGTTSLPATLDLASFGIGTNGVVLQGAAANDRAGCSVSSAGDVNGDGVADFLVGACSASPAGRSSSGAVYLVYGKWPTATLTAISKATSTQSKMDLTSGSATLVKSSITTLTTQERITTQQTATQSSALSLASSSTFLTASGITAQPVETTGTRVTNQSSNKLTTTVDSATPLSTSQMTSNPTDVSSTIKTDSTAPSPTPLVSIAPVQSTIPSASSSATNYTPIIVGAAAGGFGLAACLSVIGFCAYRKKLNAKSADPVAMKESAYAAAPDQQFAHIEPVLATVPAQRSARQDQASTIVPTQRPAAQQEPAFATIPDLGFILPEEKQTKPTGTIYSKF